MKPKSGVAVVIFIAALWAILWILGLLSPLWTRNINEAQSVPGEEFPMDVNSNGSVQVLNQT